MSKKSTKSMMCPECQSRHGRYVKRSTYDKLRRESNSVISELKDKNEKLREKVSILSAGFGKKFEEVETLDRLHAQETAARDEAEGKVWDLEQEIQTLNKTIVEMAKAAHADVT